VQNPFVTIHTVDNVRSGKFGDITVRKASVATEKKNISHLLWSLDCNFLVSDAQ
jgi:hypothetical protein